MGYRVLTALIVAVHFGYLAYVVFGGFLAWRWPRAIWTHAVAVGWGVAIVVADRVATGIPCPLTTAEDWSRRRSGQPGLTVGFIDHYLEGVVYPERYGVLAQALAGVAVLLAWLGYLRRRRQSSSSSTAAASSHPLEMPHSSS